MKTEIDPKIQEEIIKLIASILEDIDYKISGFGDSFTIKHRTRYGENTWSEWDETFYPILIEINSEKESIDISSLHLDNIKSAVWTACHELVYSSSILSEQEKQIILKRLYSLDFIKLLTGEK